MRILWFTGVQLPAVTGKKLDRAAWQEGLRRALNQYHPDLKLFIASFGAVHYDPITDENATYYNIYREPPPGSRWKRLIKNWGHQTYQDDELGRCQQIIDLVQPDLIFIFGTENPFGLLADRLQVPVIISIQAVLSELITRIFQGLTWVELLREIFSRKTLLGEGLLHRYLQLRILVKMEELIYSRCFLFEGRTDWDKNWLKRLNSRAQYFHIDRILAEEFYSQVWTIQSTKNNQIFTTSSNAPFKGGITLIRGIIELKNRGRDDICISIAGIHPDSIVGKNIRHLVSKYQLEDQVTLLGRVPPGEILAQMLQARIFVFPSHMDNSPNSLGEAMLIGMPCIASNAGGIPSMIVDGENGLLYDHADIKSLADKMAYLLDDTGRAQDFGIRARETALYRHDPERIADKTVEMYTQALLKNPVLIPDRGKAVRPFGLEE